MITGCCGGLACGTPTSATWGAFKDDDRLLWGVLQSHHIDFINCFLAIVPQERGGGGGGGGGGDDDDSPN